MKSVSQWEYALQQRVATSTFERYSFGLLMAILQAATRPIPHPQQNDDPSDATTCSQSVSQWEHAPQQRVAASTFEQYSFSLLMAILQAATQPIPTPAK